MTRSVATSQSTQQVIDRIIWSSLEHSHNAQGYLIRAIEEIMGRNVKPNDKVGRANLLKCASKEIDYLASELKKLQKKNKRLKTSTMPETHTAVCAGLAWPSEHGMLPCTSNKGDNEKKSIKPHARLLLIGRCPFYMKCSLQ